MNQAMEIEQKGIACDSIGALLAFVGFSSSKKSTQNLSGAADGLFRGIEKILNDLMVPAIESRTVAEFDSIRKEVFNNYFRTITAASNLATVVIPSGVMERLVGDSLCEAENTFKQEGLSRFGTEARDQAVFTVWTFRKGSRLTMQLMSTQLANEDLKARDQELAKEFSFYAAWAHFHLDCMQLAIVHNKIINPAVLVEMCDGLRAAVNAYGLVRQGLDLRLPKQSPVPTQRLWDEEDQELLDESMRDMASEEI